MTATLVFERVPERLGLVLVAGVSVIGLACAASIFVAGGGPGFDTYAYWLTGHAPLYSVASGLGAFQYTPAALLFLWPVSLLPWPLAYPAWLVLEFAVLCLLCRRWTLAALIFLPVTIELYEGNIHLLLALAIVAGFRYPAAWSFVLVTKTTPGVGLLWFAVRREWRSLAIALGATALLVLVSLLIPGAWAAWWAHLNGPLVSPTLNQVNVPVWARLIPAAVLVTWGGLTDRRWTVPVAATLALPSLWLYGFAMLAGCVPLIAQASRSNASSTLTTSLSPSASSLR